MSWRQEADPPSDKPPPWQAPLQCSTQHTDSTAPGGEPVDPYDAEAARQRMLAWRRDAAKLPLG